MDKYLNKVRAKDCWLRNGRDLTDKERKELDELDSKYDSSEDKDERRKIKIRIRKFKDIQRGRIVKPSFMKNVIKDNSKENSVFEDLDCNCNNIVINYNKVKENF